MKLLLFKQNKFVFGGIAFAIVAVAFQNCGQSFSVANLTLNSVPSISSSSNSNFSGILIQPQEGQDPEILSIQNTVFGSELKIRAHHNMAYAIYSLQFRGKEFIDYQDHGRELQSASSFDSYGECFNPTEAGNSTDGGLETRGTSRSLGYYAEGNFLATRTDMAFWLLAGQRYNGSSHCGERTDIHEAVNKTDRGNYLLDKQVKIGFLGIENVIDYAITYKVPEAHSTGTFEALTGYMPAEFNHFYTYQPNSSQDIMQIHPANPVLPDGEQNIPVILATADQKFAMGVYSPELPQKTFPGAGYGHFDFVGVGNTTKWNCVFRESNIPANSVYLYHCYVIVGTLVEVKAGMDRLAAKFSVEATIPTPNPVAATSTPIPLDSASATPSQKFKSQ